MASDRFWLADSHQTVSNVLTTCSHVIHVQVSGHGNFGSLDDDPPAAMRYTECRLASAAEDMLLDDLDANTVDFGTTFDASQEEPLVLPSKVPHLLVNGTQGIAVGIATKIPPHNLVEVVAALKALVDNPDVTSAQLMKHVPAPDFPTGGELIVSPETQAAYETGNGSVLLRATAQIEYEGSGRRKAGAQSKRSAVSSMEEDAAAAGGKALIVFTEMPYQVCKSDLVQRIAELVESKALDGIADVRDESDRTGVRLVVEVKRNFSHELVLNQLYKNTRLQLKFAANMVALVNGVPRTLTLKDFLQHFLDFRVDVVERRARHRLAKAEARLHLVEGLLLALDRLDQVVQAIRSASDGPAAKASLVSGFGLTEPQAEGVLAMTLRRLTGLEAGKLRDEQQQLTATIGDLKGLLGSRERVLKVVMDEAEVVAAKHGRPRRSKILLDQSGAPAAESDIREEDVIPNTPSLITVSSRGFIKRMPTTDWEAQKRGGKGKSAGRLRDNDALEDVLSVMAHNTLLFLSASGRAFSVKAHKVPEATRTAAGSAVSQVLGLPAPEHFPTLLPVSSFSDEDARLVLSTTAGGIKCTQLSAFQKIKKNGLGAIKLDEGERLAAGALARPGSTVILASSGGMVAHFSLDTVRVSGRTAGSIKGMKLKPHESLVSMTVLPPDLAQLVAAAQAATKAADDAEDDDNRSSDSSPQQEQEQHEDAVSSSSSKDTGPWLLLITSKGHGKRVPLDGISIKKGRGTQGITGIKLGAGDSLALAQLVMSRDDDVVLASRQGVMIRCSAADIRAMGRQGKGVRVISLNEGDEVQTVAVVPAEHKTALA
eukprot:GHUV01020438.1.p1 GENE.GHUV01020438.1~~GHUV01020438.1.p1  ORF type:complete len:826 (+),score=272.01 GHUV01020438.1:1150-3627(+)